MSKTIDLSKGVEALDDDDLLYLAARDNQEAHTELARREISTDQSSGRPLAEVAHTGDANTRGESIEELEARLARMKAEQGVEDDAEEDEGLEPPYDQHTNDELRAEIVRRNENRDEDDQLSITGRKDELIAELERDDEESEED